MLVSWAFGLHEVSEKTVEVNVLNELASYVWTRFHLVTTTISPTQVEEQSLAFDDVIEGLPPGMIFAAQFKRPVQLVRPPSTVKFHLSTHQLDTLANNFTPNQAYLLLPLTPTNFDVVHNRLNLLNLTIAVDVHSIPLVHKISKNTRTLRISAHAGHWMASITDPYSYEPLPTIRTLSQIADLIAGHELGYQRDSSETRNRIRSNRRGGVRNLYYIHIGSPNPKSKS